MERYLMTHSLLSAWLYAMRGNPREDTTTERDPMEDFMRTLRRVPTPPTDAMKAGIDFEHMVMNLCAGIPAMRFEGGAEPVVIADCPWYDAAAKVADVVRGGSFQHRATKEINVGGVKYLLYGRLDALKAGVIYDIKFSSHYERGKFEASTQHPVYMELLPEARTFTYLVSNGRDVWRETSGSL